MPSGSLSGAPNVTVDAPASATLTAPPFVCYNDAPTVSATITGGIAPFTIQYRINGGAALTTTANSATHNIPVGALTANATVQVLSVTSANGCTVPTGGLPALVTIPVKNPTAAISLTDNAICSSGEVTRLRVDVTNGDGPYSLSINDTDPATVTSPLLTIDPYTDNADIDIDAFIPGSGTRTYNFTMTDNASACAVAATTASATLNVTPVPAKPIITVTGGINDKCFGETVSLRGPSVGPGQSYEWVNQAAPNTVLFTTQQIDLSAVQTQSYQLRIKNTGASTCTSELSDPQGVVIRPLPLNPTVSVIAGSTTLCADGSSVTLNALASGSTGFRWFLTGSPAGTVGTTSTLTLDEVSESGTYAVRSILNGCESAAASADQVITIVPRPDQPAITSSGTSLPFCDEQGTVTLTSSITPPGVGYRWYRNGNVLSETGSSISLTQSDQAGNYTLELTRTAPSCVSLPSAATAVNIVAPPATPTITVTGNLEFCVDGTTAVTLSAAGAQSGESYQWYKGNAPISTMTSISLDEVSESGDYSVAIIGESPTSCVSERSSTRTVRIKPIPAAPSLNGTDQVCVGTTNEFYFVTPVANATYNWQVPSGVTATLGGNTGDSFIRFNFPTAGAYTVGVSVTVDGCVSPVSSKVIDVLNATATSAIVGDAIVCENQSGVVYSVTNTPVPPTPGKYQGALLLRQVPRGLTTTR